MTSLQTRTGETAHGLTSGSTRPRPSPAPPPVREEAQRVRRLRAMKRRATGLLAVMAVFRHPLGLPIPHTAVIVERKDKFGETLGAFVQENFLSPDAMSARIHEAQIAQRLGDWLADQAHAEVVAGH